jgi:glucose/mannose transport system permease protein
MKKKIYDDGSGLAIRGWLQDAMPRIVLAPSFLITVVFVYGFILWTGYLSFTASRMMPSYKWVGFKQYIKLWSLPNWYKALENLVIFGSLYIGICCILGLLLAILIDQKIRIEGMIRPIMLYPMAISFIVTGTAWKWFLNPGLGLQKTVQEWGFESFTFDWIINGDMAIYTVVMAAVWQSTGFVMAIFLAGLRGIDTDIIKAAYLEDATIFQIYRKIILPQLRPAFLSAIIILSHMAIKSYDLVIALTGGGPGNATELPATFMYSYTFTRNRMGIGAASAVIMFMTVVSIMLPYIYAELKEKDHDQRGE